MKNKFLKVMLLYALAVLLLGGLGLGLLWNYLGAYEASRSQYAVEAVMADLTPKTVLEGAQGLLDRVDANLQSRDRAEQQILDACQEPFRAVKDPGASGERELHYEIRTGKQKIGSFTLTAQLQGLYGLPQWTLADRDFDLSFLWGEPVTLTVDSRAKVVLEGKELPESYRTQQGIPYAMFAELGEGAAFPTKVTYTLEGYLGTLSPRVLDGNGRDVTGQDYEIVFLEDNCGEEENQALRQTLETFVKRYIAFSGSTKASARGNLASLRRSIASGSPLYTRLASALDGLSFGQSTWDQLQEIQYHHLLRLEEDLYFCDITYLVNTSGRKGVVQTTNNMKLLVTREGESLKITELSSY